MNSFSTTVIGVVDQTLSKKRSCLAKLCMWLTHGAAVDIKVMSLTVESANDMTSDMSRQREMASVDGK